MKPLKYFLKKDAPGHCFTATSTEETRKSKHESTLVSLETIQTRIQKERDEELEQRNAAAIEKLINLKQTRSSYENNVKGTIRVKFQKQKR